MHKTDPMRIVHTLCRIGLGAAGPAFRFQVERLVESLRDSGSPKEAANLEELLRSKNDEQSLKPSRLVASGTAKALPGETLTSSVTVPVDKETGAPLAEIHFAQDVEAPVLPEYLSSAVGRLIEEWSHLDQLNAVNAAPPLTCMLFGKPGTGKTRLAYFIGDQLQIPIVLARLDGLISSFLGTTARNIGSLFNFANRYRCLLLLDEFDALAKLRDDPQEVGEIKRVVNTLLQNIDKRSKTGFTLAITNHETLLDSAVWRRFEIRVEVPVPPSAERKRILERYLRPLPVDRAELEFLSWATESLTGSDLETMAKSLKRYTTIHGRGDAAFLDAVRAYAVINASSQQSGRIGVLLRSPQQFAKEILSSPDVTLTQQDVGKLLGKDQATISRWLKSELGDTERELVNAE